MNYYIGQNFLEPLGIEHGLELYQIYVKYIGEKFEFTPNSDESRDFDRFLSSREYQNIVVGHRNMERLMLHGVEYRNDKEIVLILKKTDYAHTFFIWHDYYPRHRELFVQQLINNNQQLLPNSLCLHLLLETSDKKILRTTISSKKNNDYPKSLCLSIGEQLELNDLNNNDFFTHWIKRALCEEFGFMQEKVEEFVDADSSRVLGLYFEKDIYNFAFLCIAHIKCSFSDFYNTIKDTIDNEEIETVDYIDRECALEILKKIEEGAYYHPSTWMRLSIYNRYVNLSL